MILTRAQRLSYFHRSGQLSFGFVVVTSRLNALHVPTFLSMLCFCNWGTVAHSCRQRLHRLSASLRPLRRCHEYFPSECHFHNAVVIQVVLAVVIVALLFLHDTISCFCFHDILRSDSYRVRMHAGTAYDSKLHLMHCTQRRGGVSMSGSVSIL